MVWMDRCLSSCRNYTVVVVDNASSDNTLSYIKDNNPNVILLEQSTNLGFGQANNIGISYALQQGADHVFLLNQDAYILDRALDVLLDFQIHNPEYGIVSPLHFKKDGKTLDEKFENYLLKDSNGKFDGLPITTKELKPFYEMRFVNAAAWLLSKKCLENVGGFDPMFFHYGEDENYCQRVLYHNFKIGVLTNSRIIHDRVFTDHKNIKMYSKAYYKLRVLSYKIRYGNVRNPNSIQHLKQHLQKLFKKSLKAMLKGEIVESTNLFKEFYVLLNCKRDIKNSYLINRTNGLHYLKMK